PAGHHRDQLAHAARAAFHRGAGRVSRPPPRAHPGHENAPAGDDQLAALGARLKHARMVQGRTLRAVSAAAGCSESMPAKLEGRIELTLGQERYLLEAGDSFYFPSDVPHGYRNPGRVQARVLWVNTPPTF